MEWNFLFFFNNVLLGVGLAMDAFSVSVANGLRESYMSGRKTVGIAGVFAGFQAFMPLLGWICVHTILQYFQTFRMLIPWIAFILLTFIGGKAIIEGLRNQQRKGKSSNKTEPAFSTAPTGIRVLLLQGVATSIDALSVGFTIAEYNFLMAVLSALIIAAVTFVLCIAGVLIGKACGTKLADRATVYGGVVLIAIGLEILISGIIK